MEILRGLRPVEVGGSAAILACWSPARATFMRELATENCSTVSRGALLCACLAVFCLVAAAQFWLVAAAGDDCPIADQWDAEGRLLYPSLVDGTFSWASLVRPHNEHRIAFTQLLNLVLFSANGGWDPQVQLFAGVLLRAGCAALLVCVFCAASGFHAVGLAGVAVSLLYMPILSWHNVLCGFQSPVWFVLGLVVLFVMFWSKAEDSGRWLVWGLLCAAAAQIAMGPGLLLPFVAVGWLLVRTVEQRGRLGLSMRAEALGALLLLVLAFWLYQPTPQHASLIARSASQWLRVFARMLAWPHAWPWAAVAMNLPFVALLLLRCARPGFRRAGDGAAVMLWGWGIGIAAATAWSRGGSWEVIMGVPSRYVDLVAVMPLANLWCAARLLSAAGPIWGRAGRVCVVAYAVLVFFGLAGRNYEMVRDVIIPGSRSGANPGRIEAMYQYSIQSYIIGVRPVVGTEYLRQEGIQRVLNDTRLRGKLPPSFQPERPLGPLSNGVRWAGRHRVTVVLLLLGGAFAFVLFPAVAICLRKRSASPEDGLGYVPRG